VNRSPARGLFGLARSRECLRRALDVSLILVAIDPEGGGVVAVPERLRRGFYARNAAQLGRKRVAGAVYVQARPDAVADEPSLLEHRYHQRCTVLGAYAFFGSAQ
jgi:hypothetical protein